MSPKTLNNTAIKGKDKSVSTGSIKQDEPKKEKCKILGTTVLDRTHRRPAHFNTTDESDVPPPSPKKRKEKITFLENLDELRAAADVSLKTNV